jgi:hypothetical protein
LPGLRGGVAFIGAIIGVVWWASSSTRSRRRSAASRTRARDEGGRLLYAGLSPACCASCRLGVLAILGAFYGFYCCTRIARVDESA